MINSVTVTNIETGNDLKLTLTSPEKSQGFAIVNMDGLGPGQATITANEWVAIDGASVVYTHIPKRNITMTLRFIDGLGKSVASIRRSSYVYFPLRKKVRLLFDCDGGQYQIEGYVEKNEPKIWSDAEETNISILCENPFFESPEPTTDSFIQIYPKFHFVYPQLPDDINVPVSEYKVATDKTTFNDCSMDVGGYILIRAEGDIVNPLVYNGTTNERIGLRTTLHKGDEILIDTRPGHKSIKDRITLENKLQYLMINSKWLTFRPGPNIIGIHADSGVNNMTVSFEFQKLYPGI